MKSNLTTKTSINPNYSEPSLEPSANVLSSKRTYTAKEIAEKLGVSDRTVSQRWLPQLEEIFYWCVADLKEGQKLTQFTFEECVKLQTAVSPRIPKRDESGKILCDGEGKVLTVKNPDRIGFETYKQQVWEVNGQEIDDCCIESPDEVLSVELVEQYDSAIATIDTTSTSIQNAFEKARMSGAILGQQIANIAITEAAKTFQEAFASGLNAMTGAMNTTPKAPTRKTRKKSSSSPCND